MTALKTCPALGSPGRATAHRSGLRRPLACLRPRDVCRGPGPTARSKPGLPDDGARVLPSSTLSWRIRSPRRQSAVSVNIRPGTARHSGPRSPCRAELKAAAISRARVSLGTAVQHGVDRPHKGVHARLPLVDQADDGGPQGDVDGLVNEAARAGGQRIRLHRPPLTLADEFPSETPQLASARERRAVGRLSSRFEPFLVVYAWIYAAPVYRSSQLGVSAVTRGKP